MTAQLSYTDTKGYYGLRVEPTYDQMLKSDHEFAPGVADFKMDSAAPVLADASGRYPVPAPGLNKKREY